MSDEFKLERDKAKAVQAEALLNNEAFKEAMDTLQATYVQAWITSPLRDEEGRERLWRHVQTLAKVREHLAKVISDGKLAEHELRSSYQDQQRKLRSV